MFTDEKLNEIKKYVKFEYNKDDSVKRRKHNVEECNKIPREYQDKPLVALKKEVQLLIATTEWGEKIYYKLPGLESLRTGNHHYKFDWRPVVPKTENTHCSLKDMTVDDFFDTVPLLINNYPNFIEILITILTKLTYSDFPPQRINTNLEIISPNQGLADIYREKEKMSPLYHHHYTLENKMPYTISLYLADFPSNIWKILNENISMNGTPFEGYSFELYIRYFDAVVQCEDCKMAYQNKNGLYQTQKRKFDYDIGRVNTVRSAMFSIVCEHGLIPSITLEKILQDSSRKGGMRPAPLDAIRKLAPNTIYISEEDIQQDNKKYKQKSVTTPLKDGIYEFYKKELPNLCAKIEVKNKKCILLAGSVVSVRDNNSISIKAKQNRVCLLLDNEGMVLEDFYLSDFTLPIVSQVICGKSINKPEKYFVRVDEID